MKVSEGLFFIRRTLNDIFAPNRFGVNKNCIYKGEPYPYSLDYTTKGMVEAYEMIFDKNGIIMMSHYIDHRVEQNASTLHYYSPVKIAHFALGAFNDYLKTGNEKTLHQFEKHIEYLVISKEYFGDNEEIILWRTPSSNPKYDLAENYVSAIVQGLVISALVRAYTLKKKSEYLDIALGATKLLNIPVEKGGLLADSKWGIAYEEYPCLPYSHVVNGFMFCLAGLKDLHMVSQDKKVGEMFDSGVDTLTNMLDHWILPYWSKYDLLDITKGNSVNLATRHYHYLHIDQLEIMWLMSEDQIFKNYRNKLIRQMNNPLNQTRIYANKFKKLILKK